MKKYYVLGLIVALSTVLVVPRVHAAGSSSVVFSEIAWGGSQKSTADEWIEIANLGNGITDVSGWTMTGLATSGGVITVPANTSLAPGGTYLIANYKMGSSSTLLIQPDLATTSVSIPNTALNFVLLDATGNVVDSLIDPGTPNAGSNTTFATMERDSSDLSWATAEVSTNLDGGQFGSPGVSGHEVTPAVTTAPTATIDPAVADSPDEPVASAPEASSAPNVTVTDPVIVIAPIEPAVALVVADPVVTTTIVTTDPVVTPDPTASVTPTTVVGPVSVTLIETVPAATEPVVEPVVTVGPISSETIAPIDPVVVTPIETVTDPAPVVADSVTTAPIEAAVDTSIAPSATPIETVPAAIEQPIVEAVTMQAPSIIITSLLPSPNAGEDETLTLTNTGDATVVIDGYTLIDASGKITTLAGLIEPNASLIVMNPAGKLNNDGDSISLFDAAGIQIDTVTYGTNEVPAPKKNVELQLIDGGWSSASAEVIATPIEVIDSPSAETQVTTTENATQSHATVVTNEVVAPIVTEVIPEVPEQSEQIVTTPIVPQLETLDSVETLVVDPVIEPSVVVAEATSATPIVSSMASDDLVITSLLPAPSTGGDEWVELTNRSEVSVDLSSYSLVDASGAATSLSGTIEAGASTMILNPKGKLNNDSDTVTLLDPAGNAVDSVTYGGDASGTPKKDEVVTFASISPTIYAEPDSSVTTNEPTAESADTAVAPSSSRGGQTATRSVATATTSAATNDSVRTAVSVVKTPAPKAATVKKTTNVSSSSTKSSTKKSSVAPRNVSVGDIASLADETLVTLEGTVVANPGVIGKRSFFVDGLEVYQSQDDLAAVSVGDHVRITGTVSVLSDHRRVNIKADGVKMLGQSTPILHDYSEGLPYGSLVRVTGTVSARDGNAVVLATNSGNVRVTLGNGVAMKWADVASKKVTVTGVLKSSNDLATVVLRSAEDVVVSADAIDQTSSVAGTSAAQNFPWSIAGLAAVAFAGLGAWFWRMKPRSSLISLTLKPTTV